MNKILLVEDDEKISSHIIALLQNEGWILSSADSVAAINESLCSARSDFALVILDRLVDRTDTKNLLPEFKRRWPSTPILVLSAINSPLDRAELLNLGVDDYLGKPFLHQELIARVRALTRRTQRQEESFRSIGNTILSLDRFSIQVDGKETVLPHKEFLLLKNLTKVPGRVWSKADLLQAVWGSEATTDSNVVEATINSLRRRIEASHSNLSVRNLRNSGYFIEI